MIRKVLHDHRTGRNWFTKAGLYRVRAGVLYDRQTPLPGPPAVVPMFERPLDAASTIRTPMARYGWDGYLHKLNDPKFDQAVGETFSMFNGVDAWEQGNDKMESLIFQLNLFWGWPSSTWGWHRVFMLRWEDGPPPGMPTYRENPLFVQKLTLVWQNGAHTARRLYYPMVARYPVYIKSDYIEPYAADMATPPPPYGTTAWGWPDLYYFVRDRLAAIGRSIGKRSRK